MQIETSLCMGCMNEKDYDGPCKLCGASESDPCFPSYLAPKTYLNERYIVGKLLNYNGEGAVYIGYDTVTATKVTIKEFMPDTLCTRKKGETDIIVNANNSPLYKTYMSEFADLNRSLMKLRGMAHIQSVLDVFSENNTCYVVYEFISGISLKSFLSNAAGGLVWDQVKEMFPPILTTLSLVHAAGIIHRGISPQTIFVTDKMELKLGGFAISAARTTNTEIACEIYSGYAAPEQYNNEPNGTWTDVYGICAVLYKALTGANPPEAIARTGGSMPEPAMLNRGVPQNVSKAIMAGMKLSVEGRIRTITDLVDKLFTPPKHAGEHSESGRTGVPMNAREERALRKKKQEQIKMLAVLAIAGLVLIVFAITFSLALSGACAKDPVDSDSGVTSSSTSTSSSSSSKSTSSTSTSQSSSSEPVTPMDTTLVPDFANESWRYENAVTTYSGLLTLTATYEYNDSYVAGLIFEQSVEAGTEVPKGTEIKVKVSKGSSVVPLPEYLMKEQSGYIEELTALNIKYLIKEEESFEVLEGNIVRCERENGVEILPDQPVDVEHGETIVVYVAIPASTPESSSSSASSSESEPVESNPA
ncbi:MAG: protein kinase [Oscillospiraceae bacterium]